MKTITTALLNIDYADGGPSDGYPLLLLHGWPDDRSGWDQMVPIIEAQGYRWFAPSLRGFGGTSFVSADTLRDGSSVAIAQDAFDFMDALAINRFAVIGHDWGGRAAYAMSAIAPERLSAIAVLAIGYTPRGRYEVPGFEQSRRWWYQWLMTSNAGMAKVQSAPIDFARAQWDTWSPPGWYKEADFERAAESFANPDWLAITLHGYRHRWQQEPLDNRYADQRAIVENTVMLSVPTLMIQGGDDRCDPPEESEGQERWFGKDHRRVVVDGVGHFPAREAPDAVAREVLAHIERYAPHG